MSDGRRKGGARVSRRAWLARAAALGLGVTAARRRVGAAGAVVGVARGATMTAATRTAVRLAGGLDFVQPGQTVLVKPNVCCPSPHPATTSPEVLSAVLELVRERKPGRLIVGDQTFYVQSTTSNLRRAGLEDAVRAHGAEFVAFDDLPRRHVRPAAGAALARRLPDPGDADRGAPRDQPGVREDARPGAVHDGHEELHRGHRRGQPAPLSPGPVGAGLRRLRRPHGRDEPRVPARAPHPRRHRGLRQPEARRTARWCTRAS